MLYFLILVNFRKYNTYMRSYSNGKIKVISIYFFNLLDNPSIEIWISPYVFDFYIFKANEYSYRPVLFNLNNKNKDYNNKKCLDFLITFIPEFVNNYEYIYENDFDKMKNRIKNIFIKKKRNEIIEYMT